LGPGVAAGWEGTTGVEAGVVAGVEGAEVGVSDGEPEADAVVPAAESRVTPASVRPRSELPLQAIKNRATSGAIPRRQLRESEKRWDEVEEVPICMIAS
jgi:hypothetical protein